MRKFIKMNPFTITTFVVVVGIIGFLFGIPFMDIMELKTIDLRFVARGKIEPGAKIVLAVVDEKSLENEGKWIWPRIKIADLVNKLSKFGARVIAFDIGFLEPDNKRMIQAINAIQAEVKKSDVKNRVFDQFLQDLEHQSNNDQLLANAIINSNSQVVLGYFFHMELPSAKHFSDFEVRSHEENIRGSRHKFVRFATAEAKKAPMIEAKMPQSNIKLISNTSARSGFFNMLPDADGVVRRMPAVLKFNDMLYAPLSFMSASAYLGEAVSVNVAEHGIEEIRIGQLAVPTDELGRILINYRGPEKTFPHISITDILNENISEQVVKDKIVIIGATAVGIFDLRVTPLGTVFPGLEIHANIVDSILAKDFLSQPAWTAIFDIMAIIVAGILLGMVLPRAGVVIGAAVGTSLFFGYIILCQHLFSAKGLVLNMVYPLAVIIVIYVAITAYRYLSESKQKRFIKDAFSTYLAPSVVSQLIQSPEKLVLGGEKRIITAFFSDVQGFTGIAEKLTPPDLVDLLNEFLTEMTDIILSYEGTVDKFEGDAIIAFFGAPNPLENQEEVACMACIEMQKKLSQLRLKWNSEEKPELKMRMGLCTGPAVVGNMGSKNRMDYTMMGDTVNTAARLEGTNKVYGIYTLISESTYKAAGEKIIGREIDYVYVFGKKDPLKIYELVGYSDDVDRPLRETLASYGNGLNAYRDRNWNEAIHCFNQALASSPGDGPSITMLARCNRYKEDPPPEDWDGAFTIQVK